MNAFEQTVSPDILCKALFDVTGIKFDANNSTDIASAAVLTQELVENPDVANALADRVRLYSHSALTSNGVPPHHFRGISISKVTAKATSKHMMPEDFPSEATSEMALNDVNIAKESALQRIRRVR